VQKVPLDEQGRGLAARERDWYREAARLGVRSMPRVHSLDPLEMDQVPGVHPWHATSDEQRRLWLGTICDALDELHAAAPPTKADAASLDDAYLDKTLARLGKVRALVPFAQDAQVRVNGRLCVNPLHRWDELRTKVRAGYPAEFHFIHGDCTFSNTLIAPAGGVGRSEAAPAAGMGESQATPPGFEAALRAPAQPVQASVQAAPWAPAAGMGKSQPAPAVGVPDGPVQAVFIDPRGYFGTTALFGDAAYDWAKLLYSVQTNYDQFNARRFRLVIGAKDVSLAVDSSGYEDFTPMVLERAGRPPEYLQIVLGIIWLSLTTYAWDDYDQVCGAFYRGVEVLADLWD
jgi:hypothetical protein